MRRKRSASLALADIALASSPKGKNSRTTTLVSNTISQDWFQEVSCCEDRRGLDLPFQIAVIRVSRGCKEDNASKEQVSHFHFEKFRAKSHRIGVLRVASSSGNCGTLGQTNMGPRTPYPVKWPPVLVTTPHRVTLHAVRSCSVNNLTSRRDDHERIFSVVLYQGRRVKRKLIE